MTAPGVGGLAEVLAGHQRSVTREGGPCLCGEWPPPTFDVEWPQHLAEAVLAHLRAVAADEGVRESLACVLYGIDPGEIHTFAASFRASVKNDVGSVLDAFLDALSPTPAPGTGA